MSKLHLVLAFHNHQPVGNFGHVLEECYQKSYLPFLETLLEHPGIRVVLHYSGYLLQWIEQNHPEAIRLLKTLIKEDRVEILSGGFYEPILAVLPERDRLAQITGLSKYIKRTLGYDPKGMWLAERVWEPQMPKYIAHAGISYLSVDDHHFKLTGLEEGELTGYFNTEDEGSVVSIFPGSEKLRYFIPFRPVEEIISYFRTVHMMGGDPLLTMGDDGEKFGVWPKTYEHCYENGWLSSFFTALQKHSDWIETTTFRDYHEQFEPSGRVYLPSASYREMGEWTLPAESSLEYEYALEELGKVMGDRSKQLLRGGIWRSFMVKYPEANHIHKRMTMISAKVHAAARKDPDKGKAALDELWQGQCNDAYWHGVFGGLYLPHLRSSLYRHLIKAETLADSIQKAYPSFDELDFDCDGVADVIARTKAATVVATELGGSLTELSLHKNPVNILDILSRRPEAYHSKIARASGSGSDVTKTIHEQLVLKEEGLADYLVYDLYRRRSLVDHFLPADTVIPDLSMSNCEELGDFHLSRYDMTAEKKAKDIILNFGHEGVVKGNTVNIQKSLRMSGSAPEIRVEYVLEGVFSGLFGIEFNISLLGSPYAVIRAAGEELQIRSTAVHDNIKTLSLLEDYLKLNMRFSFDAPLSVWHYPVETVSLSEQGIERLYQGTSFMLVLPLALRGRQDFGFTISFQEEIT